VIPVKNPVTKDPQDLRSRGGDDSGDGDGHGGGAHILLIEDHADTATVMKRLLQMDGYRVTVAHDRAGAIEAATHGHFDVVVTDLSLPDGNGIEVVSLVRNLSGPCPAIAVSGTARIDVALFTQQIGFSDYLTKPIRIEDLRHSIEIAIAK